MNSSLRRIWFGPAPRRVRSARDRAAKQERAVDSRSGKTPCVRRVDGGVNVVFHTYSGFGAHTIYRYKDRFVGPGMSFECKQLEVAMGPSGFIY